MIVHAYYYYPLKDMRTQIERVRVQQAVNYDQTRSASISVIGKVRAFKRSGKARPTRQATRVTLMSAEPRWRMACGKFVRARVHSRNSTYLVFGVRLDWWERKRHGVTCKACVAAVEAILADKARHHAMINECQAHERTRDGDAEPRARGGRGLDARQGKRGRSGVPDRGDF